MIGQCLSDLVLHSPLPMSDIPLLFLSPSCSLAELLRLRLKASSLGRGEKAVTEGDYSLLLYKKAGRTTREGSGRYTGPSTTEPCNSVEKVVKL